jgi:hypothetical protein
MNSLQFKCGGSVVSDAYDVEIPTPPQDDELRIPGCAGAADAYDVDVPPPPQAH